MAPLDWSRRRFRNGTLMELTAGAPPGSRRETRGAALSAGGNAFSFGDA
jgi:hypothetical protein